jgi:glycosyltransferase involved in cell wall biosynthesis
MRLAVSFTNFGPYHLARLRALGSLFARQGGELIAIETARRERRYPWRAESDKEPFRWLTLFPDCAVEDVPNAACARAMTQRLKREQPDAVGIVGYVRPESLAALRWARRRRRPAVLMSESQEIDKPRAWWKEVIKRRRVRRFQAALVGGPRHRDYLVSLGMPEKRIVLGYNAVDNERFARLAEHALRESRSTVRVPARPYFVSVGRFVAEKNLATLLRAYARYRQVVDEAWAWDLALCGDGPGRAELEAMIMQWKLDRFVHRPGFLQEPQLVPWYAHASAFVHPSLSEPWGLVVNEAAACGLPLLVSELAGCVATLVPDSPETTGRRFDPRDPNALCDALVWMTRLSDNERAALGKRARRVVSQWGPERFAQGLLEAVRITRGARTE